MEIKIKTVAEFRDGHVMIEVNGARLYTAAEVGDAQASEAELVAAPLRRQIEELNQSVAACSRLLRTATEERERFRDRYEVAEAEVSDAKLRAEMKAEDEGHVCTEACRPNAHVAFLGRKRLDKAEAEASEANRRVMKLNVELSEQRQRADANQAWAERAERRLASAGLELADARRTINWQAGKLGQIEGAVHGQELVQAALRTDWTSWSEREAAALAAALTSALRKVRDALDSPSLPEAASEPTSQA